MNATLTVVGSANLDIVVPVDRHPVEGETVLGGDYKLVPGGKGANQACAAARAAAKTAGGRVAMVGKIGADAWGDLALSSLSEAGVDLDSVARGRSPTGCALICVDAAGENAIAVASGANLEAKAAQVPDGMLRPGHWLVLQMEVPAEENWRLVDRARRQGCKVLLNLAPAAAVPTEVLEAIQVLVFNEVEGRLLAESAGLAADDPVAVARELRDAHGLTAVATLGAEGAVAFASGESGGESWRVAALPVARVDTTGAGDAFVGTLVAGLAAETPLPEALRRASVAAGICCETRGAQTSFPSAAQIEDRLTKLGPARAIR